MNIRQQDTPPPKGFPEIAKCYPAAVSRLAPGLKRGDDEQPRCWWGLSTEDYVAYHDNEWARPMSDDAALFEKICLEGFQSGLSWLTILRKRENFRSAFANFDPHKVARFGKKDVTRLLGDAGIVRHRGKIESTINNAGKALELIESFGSVAAFVWQFEPKPSERPKRITKAAIEAMTKTDASIRLSKDLKRRGWSFVGPTTAYAFMQSVGIVNDHLEGCISRQPCLRARKAFKIPAT